MEALTAASVAALTVYDMTKALDKGIEIQDLYLLEKTGGKSGISAAVIREVAGTMIRVARCHGERFGGGGNARRIAPGRRSVIARESVGLDRERAGPGRRRTRSDCGMPAPPGRLRPSRR